MASAIAEHDVLNLAAIEVDPESLTDVSVFHSGGERVRCAIQRGSWLLNKTRRRHLEFTALDDNGMSRACSCGVRGNASQKQEHRCGQAADMMNAHEYHLPLLHLNQFDEVGQRPAQVIQMPDHEHVTRTDMLKGFGESRPSWFH